MSNFTFNDVRSLGDAHKTYMYQFIISPLPGAGEVDERILSMRNVSCSLPQEGLNDVPYTMGGYQFHEAGLSNVSGTINATFVESMNVGVRQRLETWLELGNQRKTNIQNGKQVYQTTAEVRLQDGMHNTVYVGTFHGFWLSALSGMELNNRTNNATQVTATFTYDLWEPSSIA